MLGLVRRSGHSVTLTIENGNDGRQAVAHGKRADTSDEHSAIFSQADAARAGLAKKKNWEQYLGVPTSLAHYIHEMPSSAAQLQQTSTCFAS
jgi:hypothetical protein